MPAICDGCGAEVPDEFVSFKAAAPHRLCSFKDCLRVRPKNRR